MLDGHDIEAHVRAGGFGVFTQHCRACKESGFPPGHENEDFDLYVLGQEEPEVTIKVCASCGGMPCRFEQPLADEW